MLVNGDGAREENAGGGGGTKIVNVPTAREASKVFTDHTFLIRSKFNKTLKTGEARYGSAGSA